MAMEMTIKVTVADPTFSESLFPQVMYLYCKKLTVGSLIIKDAFSSSRTAAFCCVSFRRVSEFSLLAAVYAKKNSTNLPKVPVWLPNYSSYVGQFY